MLMADKAEQDKKAARGTMTNPSGDESYPVNDADELGKAVKAVGRGGADHDAIRRHVIAGAKKLGLSKEIPDNWNADGSLKMAERVSHTHRLKGGGTVTHMGVASPGHAHPAASDLGEDGALPYAPDDDGDDSTTMAEEKVAEHVHLKKGGGQHLRHTDPPITDGHTHPGYLAYKKPDPDAKPKPFAECSAMFAMAPMEFVEGKPLPFLTVGKRHFDDYGDFTVGPEDLRTMKELFDSGARGQDLPIINEAHDPDRAIGWIKSLEFDGDDKLVAIPDWNPVGQTLIQSDEYRYTSPEILRGWLDPQSGVRYPMIPAGLALTNYPRLKDMGRIAASEDGSCLMAFSERPISVAAARHLAFADPDFDGDDDGPTGPCVNQPPFGFCPGYTRRGDADGDGTCLLAEQCNGYRQITSAQRIQQAMGNPASSLTWAERSAAAPTTPTPPTKEAQMAETTATPAPAPAADPNAALMAEHTKLSEKFDASEKERLALAEKVTQMQRNEALRSVRAQFAELVRTGRMTPAERDTLVADDDHALTFAETNAFVLDSFKDRPANSMVPLNVRGIGAPEVDGEAGGAGSAQGKLEGFAELIHTANPKLTKEAAYVEAVKQHPELFAEANSPEEREIEMAQYHRAHPDAQRI
jgi:hypothetical protein